MAIDEVVSLPALAAMLRQVETILRKARQADQLGDSSQYRMLMGASRTLLAHRESETALWGRNFLALITPMYQVQAGSIQKEADSANHAIRQVTDRLYRLGAAYGEWDAFDVEAYFDIPEEQAERLIVLTEQPNSVHVVFFADLLLPSYQTALAYFYDQWLPAYYLLWDMLYGTGLSGVVDRRFASEVQPQMISHWQQATAVIQQTRRLLDDDVGFLTMSASREERTRWENFWTLPSTAGLAPELLPSLQDIPTLTLAVDFPLPTARQAGREERLRRNRDYGQKTTAWLDV